MQYAFEVQRDLTSVATDGMVAIQSSARDAMHRRTGETILLMTSAALPGLQRPLIATSPLPGSIVIGTDGAGLRGARVSPPLRQQPSRQSLAEQRHRIDMDAPLLECHRRVGVAPRPRVRRWRAGLRRRPYRRRMEGRSTLQRANPADRCVHFQRSVGSGRRRGEGDAAVQPADATATVTTTAAAAIPLN